jgi:histidine triad (HIT) family protein
MSAPADSVFAKIIRGEIPCQRVYEDEHVLAFLDVGPLQPGHLLLIPQQACETIDQLDEPTAAALGAVLPRLVAAVRQVTGAAGVNVLQNNGRAAGQEVPYVHFHIIPRTEGDGLGYRWHPRKYAPGEAENLRDRFREVLSKP